MKAQMQLALMKAGDPRVVRVLLTALALAMAAASVAGVGTVYANPSQGGSGGTSGG